MTTPTLLTNILYHIDRCPQCGVSLPLLTLISKPDKHYTTSFNETFWFFTVKCSKCRRHVLCYGETDRSNTLSDDETPDRISLLQTFPSIESAAVEIPEKPRRFFDQALQSIHAPDGALMLSASAIDAMLKDKGYKDGSLNNRIDKAADAGLLTEQMKAWAHEIRLSANEPRHSDDAFDGATESQAQQAIQFTKALAEYLYVLPQRVAKWKNPPPSVEE